jgi:competence protein ComEC
MPPHNQAYWRQKSDQVAMGLRVARRAARTPTSIHITAEPAIAIGYSDLSPNGAPATNSPGAAKTPPNSPIAPLTGPSKNRSEAIAIAPTIAGTISAAKAPSTRIRLRYQRGPSMSGADVTGGPSADAGAGGRVERGGSDGAYESTTAPAYDVEPSPSGHFGGLSDVDVVGIAVITVVTISTSSVVLGLGAALVLIAVRRGLASSAVVLIAVLVTVGAVRSDHAWSGLTPDSLGPYTGWARLVDDPHTYGSSTRLIVELDGERFEVWSRGRAQQRRVATWYAGDWVTVSGERQRLSTERARRVASQHVVGEFDLDWASDVHPGGALARASTRIRALIERGSARLPTPDDALFRGLVIGDDRGQPDDMIERFRASGLSHLTAVSGQNVSFLLAAMGPMLVRMRPVPRWVVTVGLVAWFVALTRFEPSILRAGAMAMVSATAFLTGRERSPVRILAIAVIGLVVLDPLIVWSVGFWLSVGATGGVCAIGPPLADRLAVLGPMATPLGITLGAQLGVAVPSLLVFGRLPLVSVPANLLAVPVAGLVMLYGLPASIVAGLVPPIAPVVMMPPAVGTRWVDTVARVGARLEPDPPWVWIGWAIVVVVVAAVVMWARSGKNRPRHDDASTER